jgi:hypothetical protein
MTTTLAFTLPIFLACAVEAVEAATIVLAAAEAFAKRRGA